MKRLIVPSLLWIALSCAAATPAFATTIVAQTVEEMTAAASLVVLGSVVETRSDLVDGSIITLTTIETVSTWGPNAPAASVVVITPGGRVGDIATRVAGAETWAVGERVLVFLQDAGGGQYRSMALAFSKFTVRAGESGDVALREADGEMFLLGPDGNPTQVNAPDYPAVMPLPVLLQLIEESTVAPTSAPTSAPTNAP
jgi:hypothetical protein